MTRRFAALTLLASAGLALAGCSSAAPSAQSVTGAMPDDAKAMSSASTGGATLAGGEKVSLDVFAAASLTESFGVLEKSFEKAHPNVDVVLNLAGSQDLVSQLAEGAPADVLATANESTMAKAADQGLVGEQTLFASNTLVLITAPGNPLGLTGLDSSLEKANLVLCAPEVPCGKLTKKLAEALGATLHPVSEEQAVTDVRGKVASGEADAGVVYKTDAIAEGDAVQTVEIPGSDKAVNRYPIARTANAKNADAADAWIELVLSAEGRKALGDAGFTPAR